MTAPTRRGLQALPNEHDACGIGFVAHLEGKKSHAIVEHALEVLRRLSHRAACGADPETGDGSGILLQLPHRFFKRTGLALGFDMPRRRRYGIGQIFLPGAPAARRACEEILEQAVAEEGQRVLGWRDVPIDARHVGQVARAVLPSFRQIYIARHRLAPSAFERKLYVIRKLAENRIRAHGVDPDGRFHIASLSSETIVYKGLLLPRQLPCFYEDFQADDMVSALAVVHSRFSTNTFPTWDLAQPFRYIAHNGEINTLRGNINWMNARRSSLASAGFGGSLDRLFPIIVPGKSDSAQFDNMLELLYLGGRSLANAIMMMIPEAWENDDQMDAVRRAYYSYAASLVEPWDGPAAIAFTDGTRVGATLDRNGLRPARYLVTDDNLVVLASETGVIDVPAQRVRLKGRLQPGRMFIVDTEEGRILDDSDVKSEIARRWPYERWLRKNVYDIEMDPRQYTGYNNPPFPEVEPPPRLTGDALRTLQRVFGYTDEDERLILLPMAQTGKEPVGSMGTDTPLAVLSTRAPTLFHYFHQLFAQVTNPAIDSIREALVMSLETAIGPSGNTFEELPEHCHRLRMSSPILTNEKLAKIKAIHEGVFEPVTLPLLFAVSDGPEGLGRAVEQLCAAAAAAIDEGANVLILCDRGVDAEHAAIPSLLAVSAVHQHLVGAGTRMHAGLLIETGEAREVHDIALLIGYGAAAVNPYLALDTIKELVATGQLDSEPEAHPPSGASDGARASASGGGNGDGNAHGDEAMSEAKRRYIQAIDGGLLKILSKMGISTIQSYRGAQIFEAVGLDHDLIDRHFAGTPSRIAGVSMDDLGRELLERHDRGFGREARILAGELPVGGQYQWRRRGELHKWNPATIARLQAAVSQDDPAIYAEYARLAASEDDDDLVTLRGLLELASDSHAAVPLAEVEPAGEIVKRFVTGAMSFGSISAEAHETLAIAMNRLGGKSNSGEGGEEAHRYQVDASGDLRRSAIKQVASGRFGVTAHYLVNADDLQIKIAQGAKPGEGGQLPGHKVDARIARVRHSTPGVTLISPPPHHDIYSIEDLAQLIYDLQTINPRGRVSVKLVSEVGVGTVAAGVAKAHAGCVVIAGDSGGTGASPISSIKHAGLPWELGLAETQKVLVANNLRGRIRVQVDGGLRTGRDVVIAALLGGEEFGMATAALVSVGCIMLRKCHLNTCSVGIATQDAALRKRFAGRPEHVVRFFRFVAEEVRQLMSELGFRTFDEMVGRVDRLRVRKTGHWKARKIDLGAILDPPVAPPGWPRRFVAAEPWDLASHVDHQLLQASEKALTRKQPVRIELAVRNADRAIGAMLSGAIAREHGPHGLPDDSIHVACTGSAGQSFGAFLAAGVTLDLDGDANDYIGKGLSGGRIVVKPPPGSRFVAEENVIIGNTALYGATGGELYVRGIAGERFAVRNSGARAVVEGLGDHGCEYMTGGVVVVLGRTGRNFAAGMSGGTAFVLDREHEFRARCNPIMVDIESLDDADVWLLQGLLADHVRYTHSQLGQRILDNWDPMAPFFVKVMPIDYKRVLAAQRAALHRNLAGPRLALFEGVDDSAVAASAGGGRR